MLSLSDELTRRRVGAAFMVVNSDRWSVYARDRARYRIPIAAFISGDFVVVARKRARPAEFIGGRVEAVEQSGHIARLIEV